MSTSRRSDATSGLFGYLVLLTAVFMLLEISFFIQRSGFYLADFKMVSLHLAIPAAILPGLIFFVAAQLCVHLAFVTFVWVCTRLIGGALQLRWKTTQTLGLVLWGLAIITIVLTNQHYFPNSKFSELINILFSDSVLEYLWIFFLALSFFIMLLVSFGCVAFLVRTVPVVTRVILGVIFVSSTAGFVGYHQHEVLDASTEAKPNIIIIGVDSLRPDYLGYMGGDNTPRMDDFLQSATIFAQALTPQARTFPAWISILTGLYPKNVNARYDLQARSEIRLAGPTLPQILLRAGYQTVFATDETRFSNIDESYGFEKIITPPVGFNDFLLGTLNDFPLSNLLINTGIGKWLFPNSYGNRPAYITYNPDSFLQMLKPMLSQARHKPLFFAIHFCLPHFPYFWASHAYNGSLNAALHYHYAVGRVDQQVGDLLELLAQDSVLKHSIVILLSDHGEALELHGDRATDRDMFIAGAANIKKRVPRFYPKSLQTEKINQSAGHGTDVMSLTQYHILLGIRTFGLAPTTAQLVPDTVTLMDIKPTLENLLGLAAGNSDGVTLTGYLYKKNPAPQRPENIFTESDFSPQAVRTVYPQMRNVLFEGIDFFKIDPVTTRLTVKPEMGSLIISSKQYADIAGSWMLALYPQSSSVMLPILLNLQTGQWTNDLTTSFAQHSPALKMLAAMQHFYGQELKPVENVTKSNL
jgi:arylsulfatase A-like enzyme